MRGAIAPLLGLPARRAAARAARALATLLLVVISATACGSAPLEEWTLSLEEVLNVGADPVTPQTALYRPMDLGFDHQGNVYVLDAGNYRVQVFDPAGAFVRTVGERGQGPGQFEDANGIFVHGDGRVWVADTSGRKIQPYAADGRPLPPLTLEVFPLDLVVAPDRIFVQRLPRGTMLYGPDPAPLITVLDRQGNVSGGFVDAVPTPIGILYMLENMMAMAPDPDGGIVVSNTHFDSLLRRYAPSGELLGEIPVLYKAGAWAPLGRRPADINDASVERIARTSSDLAWDAARRIFWVLAGYVDQTPEGEWIIGREAYRYAPDGSYRGSVVFSQPTTTIAVSPNGLLWTLDIEGVAHAFRVIDTELAPR